MPKFSTNNLPTPKQSTSGQSKKRSGLYLGHVMHHRFRPKVHRFTYPVFSILIDIDEMEQLEQSSRWFSLNRFNLFSFHEKDHGDGKGDLRQHIVKLLQQHGSSAGQQRIEVLCYPRILGYVFNPLSVYFCYDQTDQLQTIIYEVSNTFSERHSYLINVDKDQKTVRQYADKRMYVSPFTPMVGQYNFRIKPPAESVAVCISQHHDQQRLLHATFTGDRLEWNDRNLLKVFFRYPLMTLKVVYAIHWQALRLWFKGVSINRHNEGKKYSLSWQDRSGNHHYEVL